jgi:hypothetical protein
VETLHAYRDKMMTDGVFGDNEELLAIAQAFDIAITVFIRPNFLSHKGSTLNASRKINFEAKLHLQALHYEPIINDIQLDDWVLVNHRDALQPGRVTESRGKDLRVQVMHPVKSYWVWPKTADTACYKTDNVLRKIIGPKSAGSRGQFTFSLVSELH